MQGYTVEETTMTDSYLRRTEGTSPKSYDELVQAELRERERWLTMLPPTVADSIRARMSGVIAAN